MYAISDGITSGHLTGADWCFLLGMISAVLAVIVSFIRTAPRRVRGTDVGVDPVPPAPGYASNYAAPLGWLALALVAFGLFLL